MLPWESSAQQCRHRIHPSAARREPRAAFPRVAVAHRAAPRRRGAWVMDYPAGQCHPMRCGPEARGRAGRPVRHGHQSGRMPPRGSVIRLVHVTRQVARRDYGNRQCRHWRSRRWLGPEWEPQPAANASSRRQARSARSRGRRSGSASTSMAVWEIGPGTTPGAGPDSRAARDASLRAAPTSGGAPGIRAAGRA